MRTHKAKENTEHVLAAIGISSIGLAMIFGVARMSDKDMKGFANFGKSLIVYDYQVASRVKKKLGFFKRLDYRRVVETALEEFAIMSPKF